MLGACRYLLCFLLFGPACLAAELKIEVFYRGLLAEQPSEWTELMVLAPKDSGFPFDMKIPDPPGPIPAQPGVSFGSLVKVGKLPNDVTILNVKQVLRHPPMTLPDGQTRSEHVERLSVPVSLNAARLVLDFAFQEEHELVEGDWMLEGYLEDGTLFYLQRFRVVRGETSPVQPELGAVEAEAMYAITRDRVRTAHTHDAVAGALPDFLWRIAEPALNRDWGRFRSAVTEAEQAAAVDAGTDDRPFPVWLDDLTGFDRTTRRPGGETALALARETMRSLPTNAVVFGGTDFGRFVLEGARLMEGRGDVALVCQQQLVQKPYRTWLASRMQERLRLPNEEEAAALMLAYAKEIVPEEALEGEGLEFVGYSHMMKLASRLAKWIIEENPERPAFVEESFPMPWMRERMRPGPGLLLRVGNERMTAWGNEELERDSQQWARHILTVSGEGKRTSVHASLLQIRAVTRDILVARGQAEAASRVQKDLVRLCDPVNGELFGLIPKGASDTKNRLQTYALRRHKRLP